MEADPEDRGTLLWKRYELSVCEMLAALDPNAEISHNQHIRGRLSGSMRQIDVLARGSVAGMELTVVVECKRYRRPVAIGDVDQFIGKLLDVGADRGLLYSYSSFTNGALARALGASNPGVFPVALEAPAVVRELREVSQYSADHLAQEVSPRWAEDLDRNNFVVFLRTGDWSDC